MRKQPTWLQWKTGIRLHAIRTRSMITQEQLAERAGISRNTIVKIENGNDVKLSTLQAISDALIMPLSAWFLPEDEWRKWYDFSKAQPWDAAKDDAHAPPDTP